MSTCEIARKLFVSVDRKMSFVDIDSSKVVSRLSTCSPHPPFYILIFIGQTVSQKYQYKK